jgi:hypothetical protein
MELRRTGVARLPDLFLEPISRRGKRRKQSLPFKEKLVLDTHPALEHFRPLVEEYYGKPVKRTEIELITTWPTDAKEAGSQLWHMDGHAGPSCLRVFIYLTDVDLDSGPFCYAPGTNPFGFRPLPQMQPMTEAEFEKFVPRDEWETFTGPKGTVIVADILGYHRGLKNVSGERQLLCLSYYQKKGRLCR